MTIISLYFLVFILLSGLIYYIIPQGFQWIWLLLISVSFYCLTVNPWTIIYILLTTLLVYLWTNWQCDKCILLPVILISLAWFFLKGKGLWGDVVFWIGQRYSIPLFEKINEIGLAAPLAMGYYSLVSLGYILNCHWRIIKPQKNIFKLLLFIIYFPQMITGPISRYNDPMDIYLPHSFEYKNICFGAQRILWGFFKKLVIADRISIFVNEIYSELPKYYGVYLWMAILLFPIQIYADFSGCMDIVIGASEIFDIKLAENFDNPFFSRNIQEFFQKWHITLGMWAKDYVLYPVLKSELFISISRRLSKYNKTLSKRIVTALGMIVSWLFIGIWHGGWRFVFGTSMFYCFFVVLGEWSRPCMSAINRKLKIKNDTFSWHLFQSARTYLLIAFGLVFYESLRKGVCILKMIILSIVDIKYMNPWIIFDGSLGKLGLGSTDVWVLCISVFFVVIVGILRSKYGYARNWVARQNIFFRWTIWILLFVIVFIYGKYGSGNSENGTFAYQVF